MYLQPAEESMSGGHVTDHARHAVAWLSVAVVVGAWLRLALVEPAALAGLDFRHAVHAHSHLALFGWASMALFAFVVSAAGVRGRWVHAHAQVQGAASAAAFAGFLAVGYAPATIAIATVHVALWYVFVAGAWRHLPRLPQPTRRLTRAAFVLLAVAGTGALVPGIVRARGHTDPWLLQLSIELFLAPFIEGWLVLGAAAIVYHRLRARRFTWMVLTLTALGALPAALFRVQAAPPHEWLPLIGRAATFCIGAGALLLGVDAVRAWRLHPLIGLAGAAALVKGSVDIGVALAGGGELAANHQLKIAYLHLVLLGMVTPALLAGVLAHLPHRALVLAHGFGLVILLASLAALGTPALGARLSAHGITVPVQMTIAFVGGVASAVAILGMVVPRGSAGCGRR